jgi:hypothetical protein
MVARVKRRGTPVKRVKQAIRHSGGSSVGLSCERVTQPVDHPMHPQPEHIPTAYTLARRPTRDDREEELPQLRTADGRVLAVVERVDPSSLN